MQYNAKWRPVSRSESFKVTIFGTIRKPYATFYVKNNTNVHQRESTTVSEIWRIIGHVFAVDRKGCLSLTHSFGMNLSI